MKRHAYRRWNTDWPWKPDAHWFNQTCVRCSLAYNAKWHRRLR